MMFACSLQFSIFACRIFLQTIQEIFCYLKQLEEIHKKSERICKTNKVLSINNFIQSANESLNDLNKHDLLFATKELQESKTKTIKRNRIIQIII